MGVFDYDQKYKNSDEYQYFRSLIEKYSPNLPDYLCDLAIMAVKLDPKASRRTRGCRDSRAIPCEPSGKDPLTFGKKKQDPVPLDSKLNDTNIFGAVNIISDPKLISKLNEEQRAIGLDGAVSNVSDSLEQLEST